MITFAYEVKQPDIRLSGLPAWTTARYDVEAKAADDFPVLSPEENAAQVRLMVRVMLADRFRLQLHSETRQETVLKMSLVEGGFRLKEVAAPVPPDKEDLGIAAGDNGGRVHGSKVTIERIGRAFGTLARQDVIDETGLKGYYDFDIRWEAPPVPNGPPPSGRLGPEGLALMTTAFKDELGLQFSSGLGPVQYWVVDHIEPPDEN